MNKIYKKIFALVVILITAATVHAQVELVTDGSFENGPGSGAWNESSTNFLTPICDLANCGSGSGSGAHTGTYWAWFGGFSSGLEISSLSQSFIIPNGGTANLSFWLEQSSCDSPQDFLNISIDGVTVFSTDGSSPLCGVLGYSLQNINISQYADGVSHTLAFDASTFAANGTQTNIFIDDVSVLYTGAGGNCPDLITDGSLELGPLGGPWTEFSTNFTTPICDSIGCQPTSGSNAHSGTFWAWFGGFPTGIETGTLSQSVVFPQGDSITLNFWLEQIACDGPTDFLEVNIDGTQVFLTDGTSPLCGVLGYSLQTVDLSAYADGNSHTIEFNSTTFAANGGESDFYVDDISLFSCSNNPPIVLCTDTVAFNNINIPIPDNLASGVISSKPVSGITGTALGTDVTLNSVCIDIDHTWVGDLVVTLIAPSGATVVLIDRPGDPAVSAGCDGDNISACFIGGTGNEAENICNNLPAISGIFTGANGSNLNFINSSGGNPNGSWQLKVADFAADDSGTIVSWSLIFNTGPIANWTSPGSVCATAGSINLNSLVTGTAGGTFTGVGVSGNSFNPSGLSGSIPVTYTVNDTTLGCSDSQTYNIIVNPGPPIASFTEIALGLTTNFTNTSIGGTNYTWDFGDLTTSTLINPVHTYATAGTYNVTLIVTNACGNSISTQVITVQTCPDVIVNGGFELGPNGGGWAEYSLNFTTPVCDITCLQTPGTTSHSGTYWAWFGGSTAFEEGSVTQTITIAANSVANLTFWIEQGSCDGPEDFLKISVDTDTLYVTDGTSALCGQIGYTLQTLNLDAYADGNPHTISFFSRTYGLNGGATNFYVDDIALNVCPFIGITETAIDNNITVMPVPAKDYVDIHFSDIMAVNVQLSVTDMVGKNILSKTISKVYDDQTEKIDVSKWSKGVYMLRITASGNTIMRKIVIQ